MGVLLCVLIPLLYMRYPTTASARALPEEDGKHYIILIDAGSSGSRMHVHGYTKAIDAHNMPRVDDSLNKKQKPGLSSFAENPSKAGEAIHELQEFAESVVPANLRASTPIMVQSTAGLRLLPPAQAEAILETVRNEVSSWGFKFDRAQARIISGAEEGLNGWIATNYLKGVFDKEDLKEEDTFGVIEMGGASLQITYTPDLKQLTAEHISKLETVRLKGITFRVYTHSYLGYGREQAMLSLSRDNVQQIELEGNPCYQPNATLTGLGNYADCKQLIQQSLFKNNEKKAACKEGETLCSFQGEFQPPLPGEKFFAIENFFYTTDFFDVDESDTVLHDLRDKATRLCEQEYSETLKEYPKETPEALRHYCFSAAFADSMLSFAIGFTDKETTENIEIARAIRGVGIDWASGAVISALTGAVQTDVAPPIDNLYRSSGMGWYWLLIISVPVTLGAHCIKKKFFSAPRVVKYNPIENTFASWRQV